MRLSIPAVISRSRKLLSVN